MDASERLMLSRLHNRFEKAKQERRNVLEQVKQVRRSGVVSGENAEVLRTLATQSGKKRTSTLNWILAEWAFFDLAGSWSLTADDLAGEARRCSRVATSFLKGFSVPFGQPPERDPWPSATM
jgi:hypothetical protein